MSKAEKTPQSPGYDEQKRRTKVAKIAKGVAAVALAAAAATPFVVFGVTDSTGHIRKTERVRVELAARSLKKAADKEAYDTQYLRYAKEVAKHGYFKVRARESTSENKLFSPRTVKGVRMGTWTPGELPVFRHTSEGVRRKIYSAGRHLTTGEAKTHADRYNMTLGQAEHQTVAVRASMADGIPYAKDRTELNRIYRLNRDVTQGARESLAPLQDDIKRDDVEYQGALKSASDTGITYGGELNAHTFRPNSDPAFDALRAVYHLKTIQGSKLPPLDLPEPPASLR
ncbi:MAG: hypothetical protein WA843_00660 [Candidatus Saccharimonadales bacterium]